MVKFMTNYLSDSIRIYNFATDFKNRGGQPRHKKAFNEPTKHHYSWHYY